MIHTEESDCFDFNIFFNTVMPEIVDKIEEVIEEKGGKQWHLIIRLTLERVSPNKKK